MMTVRDFIISSRDPRFFYKQHFYKQHQAEIDQKSSKCSATP